MTIKKNAIVADVCVAEFGWELMEWQSHIRFLSKSADRTVVCSSRPLRGLYPYADFIPHDIAGQRDTYLIYGVANPKEYERANQAVRREMDRLSSEYNVTFVEPAKGRREFYYKDRDFVPLGTRQGFGYDVVVHARNRIHGSIRNYSLDRWKEVVGRLRGMKIACIGTKREAFHVEGSDDRRDVGFGDLVDLVASAKVAVGPSSGPMHLASLCRTPHVIFAKPRVDRYKGIWNPFGTPVVIIDELTPSPQTIVNRLSSFVAGEET